MAKGSSGDINEKMIEELYGGASEVILEQAKLIAKAAVKASNITTDAFQDMADRTGQGIKKAEKTIDHYTKNYEETLKNCFNRVSDIKYTRIAKGKNSNGEDIQLEELLTNKFGHSKSLKRITTKLKNKEEEFKEIVKSHTDKLTDIIEKIGKDVNTDSTKGETLLSSVSELYDPKQVEETTKAFINILESNGKKVNAELREQIRNREKLYAAMESNKKRRETYSDIKGVERNEKIAKSQLLDTQLVKMIQAYNQEIGDVGMSDKFKKINSIDITDFEKQTRQSLNKMLFDTNTLHESFGKLYNEFANLADGYKQGVDGLEKGDSSKIDSFYKSISNSAKNATKAVREFNEEVKNPEQYVKQLSKVKYANSTLSGAAKNKFDYTNKHFDNTSRIEDDQTHEETKWKFVGQMANWKAQDINNESKRDMTTGAWLYYSKLLEQSKELSDFAKDIANKVKHNLDNGWESIQTIQVPDGVNNPEVVDKDELEHLKQKKEALENVANAQEKVNDAVAEGNLNADTQSLKLTEKTLLDICVALDKYQEKFSNMQYVLDKNGNDGHIGEWAKGQKIELQEIQNQLVSQYPQIEKAFKQLDFSKSIKVINIAKILDFSELPERITTINQLKERLESLQQVYNQLEFNKYEEKHLYDENGYRYKYGNDALYRYDIGELENDTDLDEISKKTKLLYSLYSKVKTAVKNNNGYFKGEQYSESDISYMEQGINSLLGIYIEAGGKAEDLTAKMTKPFKESGKEITSLYNSFQENNKLYEEEKKKLQEQNKLINTRYNLLRDLYEYQIDVENKNLSLSDKATLLYDSVPFVGDIGNEYDYKQDFNITEQLLHNICNILGIEIPNAAEKAKNATKEFTLSLNQEPSGQLAFPIEGVKEASFEIKDDQDKAQKEIVETNQVIEGQIDLFKYLNQEVKELTQAEIEAENRTKKITKEIANLFNIHANSNSFKALSEDVKKFVSGDINANELENSIFSVVKTDLKAIETMMPGAVQNFKELREYLKGQNIKAQDEFFSEFGGLKDYRDIVKQLPFKISDNGTKLLRELLEEMNVKFGQFFDMDELKNPANQLRAIVDYYEDAKKVPVGASFDYNFRPAIAEILKVNKQEEQISNTAKKTIIETSDHSSTSLKNESKAFEEVDKKATKAAQAKEKFATANKKVKQSAEQSSESIQKENEAFKELPVVTSRAEIISLNSELQERAKIVENTADRIIIANEKINESYSDTAKTPQYPEEKYNEVDISNFKVLRQVGTLGVDKTALVTYQNAYGQIATVLQKLDEAGNIVNDGNIVLTTSFKDLEKQVKDTFNTIIKNETKLKEEKKKFGDKYNSNAITRSIENDKQKLSALFGQSQIYAEDKEYAVQYEQFLTEYSKIRDDILNKQAIKNAHIDAQILEEQEKQVSKLEQIKSSYNKKLSSYNEIFKPTSEYNKAKLTIENLVDIDDESISKVDTVFNELEKIINDFKQNVKSSASLDPVFSAIKKQNNIDYIVTQYQQSFEKIGYSTDEAKEQVKSLSNIAKRITNINTTKKDGIINLGAELKLFNAQEDALKNVLKIEKNRQEIQEKRDKKAKQDAKPILDLVKQSYALEKSYEDRKYRLQSNSIGANNKTKIKNDVRIKELDRLIALEQQRRIDYNIDDENEKNKLINHRTTLMRNLTLEQEAYNAAVKQENNDARDKWKNKIFNLKDKLKQSLNNYSNADQKTINEANVLLEQLYKPNFGSYNGLIFGKVDQSNVKSAIKKIESDTNKIINALKTQHEKIKKETLYSGKTKEYEELLNSTFVGTEFEDAKFKEATVDDSSGKATLKFLELIGDKARETIIVLNDVNTAINEMQNGTFDWEGHATKSKWRKANKNDYTSSNTESSSINQVQKIIDAYKELIKTEDGYQKLRAKVDANSATPTQIAEFEKLTELRNKYNDTIKKTIVLSEEEQKFYNHTGKNKIQELEAKYADKKTDSSFTYGAYLNTNRISDVNVAYDEAIKINNALNTTQHLMSQLEHKNINGFDKVFNNAKQNVEELNESLQNGKIKLEDYEKKVKNISNNLSNTIMVVEPEDTDTAKEKMYEYASSLKNVELGTFNEQTQSLNVKFEDQNKIVKEVVLKYDEMTGAIQRIDKASNNTQGMLSSFFNGVKKRLVSLAQYLLSFVSFYDVIYKFRNGITIIRELDTALTEMRKVSDETVSSLKNFQKVSFDIAGSIGTTATEIQNSTADFMRLGKLRLKS